MADLGPEVPDTDLPDVPTTVLGIKMPPGKIALGPEVPDEDLPPDAAGPITSHDNPTLSRLKGPAWMDWADPVAQTAAQMGGGAIGALAGGTGGAVEGTAVEPGGGTLAGAGAGALAGRAYGSGAGQVIEAYTRNAISRALGYEPDPVDPKEEFRQGVEAEAIGQTVVPAFVHFIGEPLTKHLFGVNHMEELGQAAVDAQSQAVDDQLTAMGKAHHAAMPVMDKAKETAAEQWLAERAQQTYGATAGRGQAKLAAAGTASGRTNLALETSEIEDAMTGAANRSFETTGQQIRDIWHRERIPGGETYAQTPVNTSHFTDTYDRIMNPATGNKPPGALSANVQRLLDRMNMIGAEGDATAGDVLDMERDARVLTSRTKDSADQFALNRMRTQFQGILTGDEVMPPEIRGELTPLNKTYGKLKDWIPGQAFTSIKGSANPADAFERLTKLPEEAMQSILQDASPEETTKIRSAAAQYFAGRDPSDAKGMLERVDKFYGENPTAYHRMFAGTPWDDPRKLARAPLYAAKAMGALNDPKFQAYAAIGAQQAMEEPELRQLSRELEKYHSMPDPESQRRPGMIKLLQQGTKGIGGAVYDRFWGYVQRRMMFDGLVTLMSGGEYGMVSRHPVLAAGMLGLLGARQYQSWLMMRDPEAYWNFVSKAAGVMSSKTAMDLGRAGARLGIITAIDAMHQKAEAGTAAAAAGTPERVIGIPASGPNAVVVP